MTSIVWLASYPKSGNTWARAFLTSYLAEEHDEFDINHLDGGPIASSRALFDQAIGVEAAALLPAEIDTLRPAAYRLLAAQSRQTLYLKVHDAWRYTRSGEPLFPADVTHSVVYIVRNPLDVAISNAYHQGKSLQESVASLNNEEFTISQPPQGIGEQLPQRLSSWSGHVRSWLDDAAMPLYLMRYEDMLAAPARVFGNMVQFLGLAYDKAKVAAAVEASSFAALRRQEERKGFRERPLGATAPFFRQGQAGSWRGQLPSDLANAIFRVHGDMMQRLGYLDPQ